MTHLDQDKKIHAIGVVRKSSDDLEITGAIPVLFSPALPVISGGKY